MTRPESSLDLPDAEMRELAQRFGEMVVDYLGSIHTRPVLRGLSAQDVSDRLGTGEAPLDGVPLETLLEDCRGILDMSRHNGHPRFFGYVASPAAPVGVFADLLASALNANVTAWRSAPAATELERTTLRWLGSMLGFHDDAAGLFTSGGSMANLIALLVALRWKAGPEVGAKGMAAARAPLTVYATDQVHHSVAKAADVLGIGSEAVRPVGRDGAFRMDVASLRERVGEDTAAGLRPFCVVASAGTTNTGAVDPLTDVAVAARELGLWFHVDGAYGAPAALDPAKRPLLAGLGAADSLSVDAHKWLYAPVDCGVLLLRDAERARRALQPVSDADYIRVTGAADADEAFAFWDYGVELSRRFRALKLWAMLRYYGVRRLAAAVADDNALAAQLAARVRGSDDFELLAPVELSTCCFRYRPAPLAGRLRSSDPSARAAAQGHLDALNARILASVQRQGEAYLSGAVLDGRFALRACIVNFRTTVADLDRTLDEIRRCARLIDVG